MTLYTASIYSPRDLAKGVRISVMSRHTLDNGKSPDTRIIDCRDTERVKIKPHEWGSIDIKHSNFEKRSFDLHWPMLAPPPKAVGAYYRREMIFEDLKKRYLEHLENDEMAKEYVGRLMHYASCYDAVLLCKEEEAVNCHRRVLALHCKSLDPELLVSIA